MCKDLYHAHLHAHTDASLIDGMGSPTYLIAQAKRVGNRHLAMTDHGTLANAVNFTIEANRQGIKPIMGLEGYINTDGQIGHITLLADGMKGWSSLVHLNNIAQMADTKRPTFTVDQLIEHNSGLICLTGCIASPLQRMSFGDSVNLGRRLQKAFGPRLFAELMFVGSMDTWKRPILLAETLGLKHVITNDVHFADKFQAPIHTILTNLKAGFEYDSKHLYLKSPNEMYKMAMKYHPKADFIKEGLLNTVRIADRLGVVTLKAEPQLPNLDSLADLNMMVKSSDRWASASHLPEYVERVEFELDVINRMDYNDYFRILYDIINWAKGNKIEVGPGRGSGAGSLVLYMLGITDVDPIMFDLQFERFLNPKREGYPDVDVDFESRQRPKVLQYANEKYGAIPIATYSRYSHKSLVRDLGRSFGVDLGTVNLAADGGPTSEAFKQICAENENFETAYDTLIGQIRHKGKHAGGVIIVDEDKLVPTERVSGDIVAAWAEGGRNELSYAGVIKLDLLGLKSLTALEEMQRLTSIIPTNIPAPGDPVFEIFREGKLAGIFQFAGSDGIRKLTVDLQPDSLADLIAINALYRPGAIDAGATAQYPEWKKSPRKIHPAIDDILEETYGAIVFQEQMMSIYRRIVGGDYADADLARRTITKAKPDDRVWRGKFDGLHAHFVSCAQKDHGMTKEDAESLWKELATHSRYSFNKSHSTAYSMIAFKMAFFKRWYPVVFYAALLNADSAMAQTYIAEAIESGIEIVMPHVNSANEYWTAKETGNKIYMPLSSVKFLGMTGVKHVIAEREANGEYKSVENFMARVPKKLVRGQARQGLYYLNCFEDMPHTDDPVASGKEPPSIFKLLGIKELEDPLTYYERQLKFIGSVVPDADMIDKFDTWRRAGRVCGIIQSKEKRTSDYGPYMVYKLSPSGAFWTRSAMALDVGQPVAVQIKKSNGKALKVKQL